MKKTSGKRLFSIVGIASAACFVAVLCLTAGGGREEQGMALLNFAVYCGSIWAVLTLYHFGWKWLKKMVTM